MAENLNKTCLNEAFDLAFGVCSFVDIYARCFISYGVSMNSRSLVLLPQGSPLKARLLAKLAAQRESLYKPVVLTESAQEEQNEFFISSMNLSFVGIAKRRSLTVEVYGYLAVCHLWYTLLILAAK